MSFFAAFLANAAMASEVSGDDVARAAAAFVSEDSIGSVVLRGCSVANVSQRSHLWIVALSPSGHVVMSGSDLADPIVGFSKNDFVEPDPESPAFAVLEGANASVATAETQGTGARHARWTKLLGGMAKKGLLKAADVESPDTIVIPPFIESHYNQWQPYNDYAPVHEASTNDLGAYRGRCPCGCVATAAAQGFRHFRWPVRMDRVDSFNHNFTDASNVTKSFPLRFDGNVPIDWSALEDDYINSTSACVTNYYPGGYSWGWQYSYDLRGTVPEATRHPISRLIMFADVLAHMSFASDCSSANYGTVASNASDWYTQGTWVSPTDARVQTDIENGVPVQVSVPGHAVVGHGWANDGSDTYIYLNYGWGGSSDGYYNINGTTIQNVFVGHYPRAKPQVDPLPTVSGTSLSLNWHFPDFYTNNLSGFTVSISRTATTPSTFLDDFSASSGISDAKDGSINNGDCDKIYVGNDSTYGSDCGKLLYVEPLAIGHFTYPDKLALTDSSRLAFKLRSVNANGCVFEIQARFNDGEWITLHTPPLSTSSGYMADSKWQSYNVDLSAHAGETAVFRINKDYEWVTYYPSGRILLDDFSISNVLMAEAPTIFAVDADRRSCEVTSLEDGRAYSFVVRPVLDANTLVAGEASEAVSSTIGANTALGEPEIISVSAVAEGFYGECGTNTTTFSVVCSETVEALDARPSHLSLVRDEDVSVSEMGNGKFKVCVTPSGINESNFRSRMILTLVGTDSNGTKCYKDISLRFSQVEPKPTEVHVAATTSSGDDFSVEVPYSWIESFGLAAPNSDAAAHEAALASTADTDSDGLPNWAEYVCGTSPTDPTEKLVAFITMVNGEPVVTYSPGDSQIAAGFKAVIKGATDLSAALSAWEVVTETRTSTCRFFRVEIVPEN